MKSMTGFGRSTYIIDNREYSIDIKSVNHKYSDISIKMPRSISYLEDKVRQTVVNKISRGKVDVYITFENYSEQGKNIKINSDIAKAYIKELKGLSESAGIIDNVSIMEVARLPDVLVTQNKEDEEILWNEIKICLDSSIENFMDMRNQEGNKLKLDILDRLKQIELNIVEINENSTGLVEEYILKLEERIKEILKTDIIDKERLAMETVIYADKTSIEEELTRLKSHISQFKGLLDKDFPIGKKLDFIVQEMNREINTVCSKANNINITNLSIDVKTQIENIREQIQNVE